MAVLTLPRPDALSVRAKAFVFEDSKSRALLRRVERLAPSDTTVLIYGETGTGKEIIARHLHDLSSRRERAFVAVNCGALTDALVESELFGHERGAFTGAESAKAGWFEVAQGGSLFLDEVTDLSPSAQVKLLRVLQEDEVVRLGSRLAVPVDVRLIAATNVALEEAVTAGRFREDLYYRLNVASLTLLPLRERTEDILPLALHFLDVYRQRLGISAATLAADAIDGLLAHSWPGNIRELENVVHHALLLCHDNRITYDDLRLTTLQPKNAPVQREERLESALLELFERDLPSLHGHIEACVIRAAYKYCDRNQLQTARLLGISRNVVRARLIQCGELAPAPRAEAAGGSAQ